VFVVIVVRLVVAGGYLLGVIGSRAGDGGAPELIACLTMSAIV
jgi:hypothetical protein